MFENAQRTMGLAGITAGATFFLGQGGELVFGDHSRPLFAIVVVLTGVAVVSFGVAFLAMRQALHASRAGRIGATIGVVGDVFLLGFAVQLGISAARTGEVPQNFALFALGFLMTTARGRATTRWATKSTSRRAGWPSAPWLSNAPGSR
jgi:hypothetical protein